MGAITRALPRSGSAKINNMGNPTARANFTSTWRESETVPSVEPVKIEAVPAYNLIQKRPDGAPFHPKGVGNGYVLTFGDKRVYVAGDT